MKARPLSMIPVLLFAVLGSADEPVRGDAPVAEAEPAAEEAGSGSETAEEVTAHNITKTLIGFRPGKRFKEVLANLSFEKE